jgi:hypothetical protein
VKLSDLEIRNQGIDHIKTVLKELNGQGVVSFDLADAYSAGFKGCEAMMLESAAKDWVEYWDYLTSGGNFQVSRKDLHQQTFAAGAISQAKRDAERIKELGYAVIDMAAKLKFIYPECGVCAKHEKLIESLKQGGEG